jgi:hypothetical protein
MSLEQYQKEKGFGFNPKPFVINAAYYAKIGANQALLFFY